MTDATPTTQPPTPAQQADLYKWSGDEEDCPADLVINASNAPLILGAQAFLPSEPGRIMPGDRRQGEYYLGLIKSSGLAVLRDVPPARRLELDKMRRLRSGDRAPAWAQEAWKRLPEEDQKRLREQGLLED